MDCCLSIKKKSLASPYHCRQNTSLAGTHGVPRHSAVRHRHCGATTTSSMGSTKTNHQRNCEHIRADFPIKRNASCTPGPSHDWTRPAGAHLVAHGNSIVVRGNLATWGSTSTVVSSWLGQSRESASHNLQTVTQHTHVHAVGEQPATYSTLSSALFLPHWASNLLWGARSPTSASLWTMAIRGSAVAPSHIHGL